MTVTAGQLREITFTYQEANIAPTISSIANIEINPNVATASLDVTLFDADQDESTLVLTSSSSDTALVPISGIVFGGSNADRNVTITPASGRLGSAELTLTVSDGSSTSNRVFTVTVTGTAAETWRFTNFNTAHNSGDSADNADPDGDSQTNINEYVAGTNPKSVTDVFKISSSVRTGTSFSTIFQGKAGRSYLLRRSLSLTGATWETVANSGPLVTGREVTMTDLNATSGKGFYRISVELSSP